MPRITVAVCTYDRYAHLEHAIVSLTRQTLVPTDFRIMVVDNSPGRAAGEEFAKRHRDIPNLDYRFADRPGLSNARNAAIAACSDELIAFIDDDALARPTWLAALVTAFDSIGAHAAAVGGAVELLWSKPRPPWLGDEFLSLLSALDWGPVRREIVPPGEWLVGTNIAFRRDALIKAGGFAMQLGRHGHGTALLSNEEVETLDRIRSAGGGTYFEPQAIVDHYVHTERLTREWLRRRIVWQRVSEAIGATLREGHGDIADAAAAAVAARPNRHVAELLASLCNETEDPDVFREQIYDIAALVAHLLTGCSGPTPRPADGESFRKRD